MIRSTFTLRLNQDGKSNVILFIPSLEWLQKLQSIASGAYEHLNRCPILRGGSVRVLTWIKALSGQSFASGFREFKLLAIGAFKGICQGIEIEGTRENHGS